MQLPKYVLDCVNALEAAGFEAWAVGGCVRDACLGITPHDYDLCTNALPDTIQEVFSGYDLVLAGKKHGTVSVITRGGLVEITTFRTEGGYRDNRHPDWVEFVSEITGDLARRDFTVNAMAWSPTRGFADPFGGRQDLKNRVLRAVGDPVRRFEEDSLRILRGVRFAVRYRLALDGATERAMGAQAHLMENLARERVFDELCKLLMQVTSDDLLRYAQVLAQAIPELGACVGFQQHSPYHAYDVFTHISHVVENTPAKLSLRWAALLHDVGKPPCFTRDENGRGHFRDHAKVGSQMADDILRRLKAPTALREQVVFFISHHMIPIEPERRLLLRRLSRYGSQQLLDLLDLQEADMSSKGTGIITGKDQFPLLRDMIRELLAEETCLRIKDLAVTGSDLMALGFAPGPALGKCLEHLLNQVLDEKIPNEREPLLLSAKKFLAEVTL